MRLTTDPVDVSRLATVAPVQAAHRSRIYRPRGSTRPVSAMTVIQNRQTRFYSTRDYDKIQNILAELVIDPTNDCVGRRYDPADAPGLIGI